ncbi:MAG TPA: M1 family aminopeptidase, partial [Terriglobales bacterium]
KVMDALYGRNTDILNMFGAAMAERDMQRLSYVSVAYLDPMTANSWDYATPNAYGGTTYGKTATVLLTLEAVIGEAKMQQAIRTWFQRYKFTHPTEEDFMNTVNEVAGQDLTWYWNQAVKGTNVLDYRILSASSVTADGKSEGFSRKPDTPYDTTVIVHRKGDFVMPVQLEVKFDNGETVHETWDGKDRWHRFQWRKNAKVVSAEVDYKHQLLLDDDRFNNSYLAKSDTRADRKIVSYWMILTQWLGQMLAWLT